MKESGKATWISHLAVLLFATVLMLASAAGAIAQSFQFDRISVEGNQRIEPATILSIADLPTGQSISAGQVNEALQRTLASGFFEDVEFVPRGNTLVIRVQERPTISRVNIEGNRRIDDDVLLAQLSSQSRRVYDPEAAEADALTIIDAYRQSGRFAASVTPSIIRRADNRVDLVFEVVEGNVVEIERISFVGNTQFSDRRLRQVLATKQAGVFRQIVQRDTFIAERLQFDRQLLTDFYRSRGFVDFAILDVASEFSRERNATFLTFTVREGQQFEFGDITVSSFIPGIDPAIFEREVRIRPGQTYSPVDLQTTVDRMERLALRERLDFVAVEPSITRNDRTLTLDVDLQIVRAPRVFVERIDIEGNTTTVDRVIRQQFGTVEGDPFNPREIERSAERIRALGFFETADVESRQGSAPDQVVIDVDVVEQPTGSLSFGITFSVEDGAGAAIGFSERNFLGRGQTLAFDLAFGSQNQNWSINFIEPFFLGRDVAYNFEAFFRETDFDNTFFNTENIGFSTGLTFPLNDNARLRTYYLLSEDTISDVTTDSSPILQREAGTRLTSALGYEYRYNTIRGGLNPNAGLLFTFGQELGGFGGDNQYLRTTTRIVGERRVLGEDVTLRARFDGGALNYIDSTSRIIDRFSSSSRTLRGFESRGIGPRDTNAVNQDVLGGNFSSVVGLEAEFPIGLPEEYGVRGGLFFNAGSIWGLDDTDGAGGPDSVDDSFELRSAIGFSLFWDTPIGPLRLDFAEPIERNPLDQTQGFNLSVTTSF